MQNRLKLLWTLIYSMYSLKRPLTPAYYARQRLLVGGALAFCLAVMVQLLQIPPPQLTTDLRLALWGAAVAIPLLAGVLWIYATRERVTIRHETHYAWCPLFVGLEATFVCAAAIFQHFSGAVAIVFFALSVIVTWCGVRDQRYHDRINELIGDLGSTMWVDTLAVLVFVIPLLGGWLLVRFLALRYL